MAEASIILRAPTSQLRNDLNQANQAIKGFAQKANKDGKFTVGSQTAEWQNTKRVSTGELQKAGLMGPSKPAMGWVQSQKRMIGEEGAIGSMGKLAKGGAVAIILEMMARAAEAMASTVQAYKAGEINAWQAADQVARQIPVLSQTYRIVLAINRALDDEESYYVKKKKLLDAQLKQSEYALARAKEQQRNDRDFEDRRNSARAAIAGGEFGDAQDLAKLNAKHAAEQRDFGVKAQRQLTDARIAEGGQTAQQRRELEQLLFLEERAMLATQATERKAAIEAHDKEIADASAESRKKEDQLLQDRMLKMNKAVEDRLNQQRADDNDIKSAQQSAVKQLFDQKQTDQEAYHAAQMKAEQTVPVGELVRGSYMVAGAAVDTQTMTFQKVAELAAEQVNQLRELNKRLGIETVE